MVTVAVLLRDLQGAVATNVVVVVVEVWPRRWAVDVADGGVVVYVV